MILKVFILAAVMSYYHNSQNAMRAAILWGALVLIFGLLFAGFEAVLFLWAAASFIVALGVFTLLDHLDGTGYYWPALVGGVVALMLVG